MSFRNVSKPEFQKILLRRTTSLCWGAVALGCATLCLARPARALNTYQIGDWTVDLNVQLEYYGAVRVNSPSQQVLTNANANDGDQNLQHGLVSSEFETVPSFTAKNGNLGVRISGEAYLNTVYLQQNQNGSPGTLNSFQSNNKSFNRGTVAVDGRNAELLDAYAFDSVNFGASQQQSATFKVGRQTLLWGQSLQSFDGIAGGQSPIDVNEATSLANPQLQQVILPVGQAVLTYQPNNWVTFQGYYQFEWRKDQFPGNGSYFGNADFLFPGGESLIFAATPRGPVYVSHGQDNTPPANNGQFGLSSQFQLGNYDLGFYGLRFDSKSPVVYLDPSVPPPRFRPGLNGTYSLAYPRDIQIYGASLSTDIGSVNVGGEISGRRNQDLYSDAVFNSIGPMNFGYNANSHPGYAVGDVINAQASVVYLTPPLPYMPGGMSLTGELVYNTVVAVTANRSALVAGRTPSAAAFTITATPVYYNVLPSFDVQFPLGFAWTPVGRSQFDQSEQAGTGSVNIGVTGTYKVVWKLGLNYEDFLGSNSIIPPGVNKQGYADRGNVSFFISRTF